jgi:hypothetical protein
MPTRRQQTKRRQRKSQQQPTRLEAASVPKTFRLFDENADVVKLEAAASGEGDAPKLRRFSMKAYTGGKLFLGAFPYPVVVDLAGMKVSAKPRPILRDHNQSQIVGHTDTVTLTDRAINVTGTISAVNEFASEVAQSSDNGFPWQASIGANAQRMVFVDSGETVTVNGQKQTGPLYVARQSTLGEVSFVALGADDKTTARMVATSAAATQTETLTMKFEAWIAAKGMTLDTLDDATVTALRAMFDAENEPADDDDTAPIKAKAGTDGASADGAIEAMRAEGSRINAINAACAKHPTIAAKAIQEGWDASRATMEVELTELRAGRPKAPDGGGGSGGGIQATTEQVLQAALYQAVRVPEEVALKACGEQSMEAAHKTFRGRLSLQQVVLEAAWANGYTGRRFEADNREFIRAAFSTMTLTNIFADVANKKMLNGFDSNDDIAVMMALTSKASVKDFKQVNSYRLSGNLTYQKVGPDGELKHGSLSEDAYTNQAATYGIMYAITRTDFINDDLNALDKVPYEIGVGGSDKLLDVFWTEFLDNSSFFATGNANYAANYPLTVDNLTYMENLFLLQTKPNGKPLGTSPRILLVPTALKTPASVLMTSAQVRDTTASTKAGIDNPHVGKFTIVSTPYLSNNGYTGYSALAWYLLADPIRLPVIETVFLNGQESPTVESADAAFNTLGVEMRGYHDFGCNKQEYRGGVKSKGEA